MRKLLLAGLCAAAVTAGCDAGPKDVNPPEGCRGHGGVVKYGPLPENDATNSEKFVACEDGTIVKLHY